MVEIACKPRSSGCYCGNDVARQSVELKFGDFVDYYQATAATRERSHWLQTVDELDFYLAQCPIAVRNSSATAGTKAVLPAVANDVCMYEAVCCSGWDSVVDAVTLACCARPACLGETRLTQVNLWMTVQPSRTALHYDAYHNVLVILYGRKIVTLYPPSETAKMYPFPVHSKSVNHSRVDAVQPDVAKHARFSEASAQQFTVMAGGAVLVTWYWSLLLSRITASSSFCCRRACDSRGVVAQGRLGPVYNCGQLLVEWRERAACHRQTHGALLRSRHARRTSCAAM